MLWLVVLLAFIGLFILWTATHRTKGDITRYMNDIQKNRTSLIEQHGVNILRGARSSTSGPQTLPVTHQQQSSTRRPIPWEQRIPSPQAKSLLHPDLAEVRDRVLAIMVGTYHLDPTAISYLQINMDYLLTYLLQNKVKAGMDPSHAIEMIREVYNPTHNNELVLEACRDLMHYQPIPESKRILVAQYIVNRTADGEEIEQIYQWITGLVADTTTPQALRAEAADMLMLTNNSRYMGIARQALEQLRREDDRPAPIILAHLPDIERPAAARPVHARTVIPEELVPDHAPAWLINQQRALLGGFEARQPKIVRTVHEDGQNVHNKEINNSVLEAAANIIKDNRTLQPFVFDKSLTKDMSMAQKGKIDAALHRIATDSTTFKHGTTLYGLFQSLQSFIDSNPHKQELNKRLTEELTDMSGQCATGHLARLVNVVQGFEGVPQQKITMNIGDEVYARVSHSLTQALQRPENSAAADAMVMGDDRKVVNEFVANQLNRMAPELIKEYKDIVDPQEVKKQLVTAAKTYTKDDSFVMKNELVAPSVSNS